MTEHRDPQANGKLPLPAPRSPQALDARILSASHARAPSPRRVHYRGWLGGAVTASVIVLAVYLTGPLQDTTHMPAPAESGKSRATVGGESTSTMGTSLDQSQFTQPMADAVTTHQVEERAEREQFSAAEQQVQAEPGPAASTASTPALKRLAPDAAGTSQLTGSAEVENNSLADDIRGRIHDYAALLTEHPEDARAAYQALRESCPQCSLPPTLEQAHQLVNDKSGE
tara:strand:- start:83068 stop:83751 length:684 start_codon:yes stop_codon:yes gene_type:complete